MKSQASRTTEPTEPLPGSTHDGGDHPVLTGLAAVTPVQQVRLDHATDLTRKAPSSALGDTASRLPPDCVARRAHALGRTCSSSAVPCHPSYGGVVTFWILALALFTVGVVLITLAVRDHR